MTTPPPAKPRQPFAFQAAIAGIGAPLISIILNFVFLIGSVNPNEKSSPLSSSVIGQVSLLLVAAGFVFSIIALVSIPKHGRKGLLGRGIGGLILNGLLLAFVLLSFWFAVRPDPRIARLAGSWECVDTKVGIRQQFDFLPQQQFHYRQQILASNETAVDFSGKYGLSKISDAAPPTIVLSIADVTAGSPDAKNTQFALGLESLSDSLLQLRDKSRLYNYSRAK